MLFSLTFPHLYGLLLFSFPFFPYFLLLSFHLFLIFGLWLSLSLPCLALVSLPFSSPLLHICSVFLPTPFPPLPSKINRLSLPFLALFSPPLTLPLPHLWSVADPFPLSPPSRSRQEQSTHPRHELRGRPLGFLHSGMSRAEITLRGRSTSGRLVTCSCSRR